MRFVLAGLIGLALLAGCGEDDDEPPPAPAPLADLVVVVDTGREPREARVRCAAPDDSPACRAAAALTADDFAPVPGDVACTQIYGGAETARVTGTLRGERVDARFSRTNGCEIARWDEVADLLAAARP
jgi:nitrous oxide reductase accessory protein NosL